MKKFLYILPVMVFVMIFWTDNVFANTIVVDSLLDDGNNCTLRDAINEANNTDASTAGVTGCAAGDVVGADDITWDSNLFSSGAQTSVLASELPSIFSEVNIIGPGADLLSLDGNSYVRHLRVESQGIVNISGLRFINGRNSLGGSLRNGGIMHVSDCYFSSNFATGENMVLNGIGGAILNSASLSVEDTTFDHNEVTGVPNTNDYSKAFGGAVACQGGTCSFERCVFSDNTSTGATRADGDGDEAFGGAIYANTNATVDVVNSTFKANIAAGGHRADSNHSFGTGIGGAIYADSGNTTCNFCTFSENQAATIGTGGGVAQGGNAQVVIKNSIISDNLSDDNLDCSGTITSGGGNVFYSSYDPDGIPAFDECGGDSNNNDINTNPGLAAFNSFGGVFPISTSSSAFDHISAPCGVTTDRRGQSRPSGAGCDSGSYEN